MKYAVSKRLSDLEKALGVELIRRSTRKLRLTDTGRSYYRRCVEILAEVDELNESIRGEKLELRGRLKVTTPLSFGLRHLQPVIIDFAKQHPALEFDLIFSDHTIARFFLDCKKTFSNTRSCAQARNIYKITENPERPKT